MRLPSLSARNVPAAAAAALVLVLLAGAVTAVAATHPGHGGPRRVAPPASLAHADRRHGRPGESTTTTANPMTLDPPVQSPPTQPVVVTSPTRPRSATGHPRSRTR
jgi:hypothetical protein